MTAKRKPDALLPCPFCGATAIHESAVSNTGGRLRYKWCGRCRARGPWAQTPEYSTADKWNTRATSPAIEALVEAAKLQVLNFERQCASGDGFLCDDDHEAWTALNAALALWQPATPDDSEVRK